MGLLDFIRELDSEDKEKNLFTILAERVIDPDLPPYANEARAFINSTLKERDPIATKILTDRYEARKICINALTPSPDCYKKNHFNKFTRAHFVPIIDDKAFNVTLGRLYICCYEYHRGDGLEAEKWEWHGSTAASMVRFLLRDRYEPSDFGGEFVYKDNAERMIAMLIRLAELEDKEFEKVIIAVNDAGIRTISKYGSIKSAKALTDLWKKEINVSYEIRDRNISRSNRNGRRRRR